MILISILSRNSLSFSDRITVKFLKHTKSAKALDVEDSTTVNYSIINDKTSNAKDNAIGDDIDVTNERRTDNNDNEINKDGGRKAGKLKLNTHQCYVCFKVRCSKFNICFFLLFSRRPLLKVYWFCSTPRC